MRGYINYSEPGNIWKNGVARLCRIAVTEPLYGVLRRRRRPKHLPIPDRSPTQGLPEAFGLVSRWWRSRLVVMGKLNWLPLTRNTGCLVFQEHIGRNIVYAANCPPYGADFDPRGRLCNHPRVCPWCYCRRVAGPVYESIVYALFKSPKKEALQYCHIVAIDSKYEHTPGEENVEHLWETIAAAAANRQSDLDTLDGVKGYIILELWYPGDDRGIRKDCIRPSAGSVILRRVTLAIVQRPPKPADEAGRRITVLPALKLTRKRLIRFLAANVQYPVSMFIGDAGMVVQILDSIPKNTPILTCGGVLRNATARKKLAAEKWAEKQAAKALLPVEQTIKGEL